MKFWTKTLFWENVKRTLATFSGPTVLGLDQFGAADKWVILAAVLSMIGGMISIWMTDNNNNGRIDLFENEKL
jgi:nucleoside permease NupC